MFDGCLDKILLSMFCHPDGMLFVISWVCILYENVTNNILWYEKHAFSFVVYS